jgi:SAM-dependent methyltransferase
MQLVQRVEFIKAMCAGKKVLHLGCTNWPYTKDAIDNDMLLHFELKKVARELYGFDYDQQGIDTLAAAGVENLYRADLEKLDEVDLSTTFDLIIAGEMIEHLNNPGLFLAGIRRFMDAGTKLVITTINAYCGMRFALYGLRGRGGTIEPVHPDHVAYYSYSTLKLLIERHDLRVDELLFYDIGSEHRPMNRWYLNLINDVCVKVSPQLADGLIAVCSLK